jgi:hypothetical protein
MKASMTPGHIARALSLKYAPLVARFTTPRVVRGQPIVFHLAHREDGTPVSGHFTFQQAEYLATHDVSIEDVLAQKYPPDFPK